MKISRLLVLSALGLASLSVNAADLLERTKPTAEVIPEVPTNFQVGKEYVLYNTGTQLYFTQGNTWGTRGCVGPKSSAVLLKVAEYKVEDVWDGKTYEIENYVTNRTAYSWYKACMDDDGNLYLDQSTWGNRFYEIQVQTDGLTYRLMPAEANAKHKSDGTQFVGRDESVPQDFSNAYSGFEDDGERFPLSAMLTEEEGHYIDWQFFDAQALVEANEIYELAENLKTIIGLAEEKNIDVTAAVTVYNDEDATKEQIQAAIDALNKALSDDTFSGFTPGTALDVSSLIVNPDFKGDDLATGWSGSGWGSYGPKENAERFNMNFNTYQDIAGLRPGLYVAGVNAFYRAGDAGAAYTNFKNQTDDAKNAKLYVTAGDETFTADIVSPYQNAPTAGQGHGTESSAQDPDTEITYYIPNNMEAAEYYMHNLGLYKNSLFFETSAGQIRLGMKKDKTVDNDWVICDDFSLIYCGEGADAYNAYVNFFKTQFPDYEAQRTEWSTDLSEVKMNYTKSYLDAFNALEVSATNAEEALAAVEKIKEAHKVIEENVALWKSFIDTAKEAQNMAGKEDEFDPDYLAPLGDWIDLEAGDIWDAQELTNEEISNEIAKVKAMIAEALKHPIGPEAEVTNLLVNPDYEDGFNGWTRVAAGGGNVALGGNDANHCYEAWNNSNFDIYQVVKEAPAGIYRIEVQGFYRYGRGQAAYDYWVAQEDDYVKPEGVPVYIYMNAKKTPFASVFDEPVTEQYSTQNTTIEGAGPEGETCYYPDGMVSSAEAFSAGMYKRSAYGIIKEGQEMRIGVKGSSNQLGDSWVIWDNFRLFNCGSNADAVMNVLPDEIEHAKTLLSETMGKTTYEELSKAVAAAEAALETEDGDTMFKALSDLFDAEENVNASIALFKELNQANEDLTDAIGNSSADGETMDLAGKLQEEIAEKMANHEIEDEDVPVYLQKIEEMMTKLLLPDGWREATDLNAVDVTAVIRNADFDGNNGNKWKGTEAGFQTFGNAELYNKNYDFYQDIAGLPAGTYELQVQGFYRAGTAQADWDAFQADPTKSNNAFLYGMVINDNDSVYSSNPLVRLASDPNLDQPAIETDYVAVKTDTLDLENEIFNYITVPNMMSTAATEFDLGKFTNNKVIVKVGENGKLRVGLRKNIQITTDWTIFDNFKLIYYGANSELQPTPDGIENITNAPALSVEYFTLDGRKATAAQRGLVIVKQTLSNGAVIVKKVQK